MYDGIKPVSCTLGLMGDNITASFTPPIHEMIGCAMGMSVICRPIDLAIQNIGPDDLIDILAQVRRFGFSGLNTTAPCRQPATPFLDDLSERTRSLQTINTVMFRDDKATGHNTDWCGFTFSFRRNLPGVRVDNLVLMGANGVGSAVAYGILSTSANTITILDIIPGWEMALVECMTTIYGPSRALAEAGADPVVITANFDGVIDAATRGMAGYEAGSSVPTGLPRPKIRVVDYIYLLVMTELFQTAERRGCRVPSGTGMMVEQTAEASRLFAGVGADSKAAHGALDALLAVTPSR